MITQIDFFRPSMVYFPKCGRGLIDGLSDCWIIIWIWENLCLANARYIVGRISTYSWLRKGRRVLQTSVGLAAGLLGDIVGFMELICL